MATLMDPFDALSSFQQALDTYRTSRARGERERRRLSAGQRVGDDFIIIAELPGVKKSDLEVQVKGRTIRLAGRKRWATRRRRRCIGASGSPAGSTGQ